MNSSMNSAMKNAISWTNSVITSKIGRFKLKSPLSKDCADKNGDDNHCRNSRALSF